MAPARCELFPAESGAASPEPVAEHAHRQPDVGGGKSPVGQKSLPAGSQDAGCELPGRCVGVRLMAAALIGGPELADGS
ncbi:MAG: hypothetical protein IVW55_18400 [Chloroflexi bacterium]|nr:hypothetical protein [Chloroflexota bacterium]